MGSKTITLSKTGPNLVGHNRWRRPFIGLGYSGPVPVSDCFYKRTIWGLAKICPDLD